jgi:two-component system, OmpR family, alkaline phosphatase synthesis response regulator PhoP
MGKEYILVVDDEEDIQELIRYNLAKEGYSVRCVGSGEEALESLTKELPGLIILDLMLPGLDGLDVCKALKGDSRLRAIPVIMLSARGEEADVVSGLELGAEDYVTKPFSPRVLSARIKNVLKRGRSREVETATVINIAGLSINPIRREVTIDGSPVELTFTEFSVLAFLARQPGWVFTRYQIVDAVRGGDYPVTERSVDVQIVGLRKKLGPYGKYIETVRGVGYRFKD